MAAMPIDDRMLREYLLGTLDPDNRVRVEDRLFSDDQLFWEHLCLIEDELISDFARGALAADDRAAFLERFACTEERRSKVAFAQALQAYVENREAKSATIRTWLRHPLSRPAWAAAAAAALVLLVLTGTMLQHARVPSGSGAAVVVALSSGLTRGAGDLTRVSIPSGTQWVRFELDAGSDRHPAYRATLFTVDGDELWSEANLTAAAATAAPVVVTVPSTVLTDGDYYIRLEGLPPGGEPVPLPRYDFRVLRD